MKNLPSFLKKKASQGFTLIELLVVIAILGVLAVVLITVIDPIDKIAATNDAAVISSVAQFGKANDGYAATHNNFYAGGTAFTGTAPSNALAVLSAGGETKVSTYTPPSGYTLSVLTSPAACTAGTTCTDYAYVITNLKSKKNTTGTPPVAGPIYQVVNGKGCYVSTAITQAQLDALDGASSGTGACP